VSKVTYAYGKKSQVQQAAITALTDNTGGTADNTLASVEASYTQATIRNNFADLGAKVNSIISALKAAGITL